MSVRVPFGYLVLLIACLFFRQAHATDVTACGATVARTMGIVQTDLDCTGAPGVCLYAALDGSTAACTRDLDCGQVRGGPCVPIAITLSEGATLDLGGHTIAGAGILCRGSRRCRIRGPGTIVGAAAAIVGHASLRVSDVDVLDGGRGIFGFVGRVRVERVHALRNASDAITSMDGTLRAMSVVATDNGGEGLYSVRTTLRGSDLVASRNGGTGVDAGAVRVQRLTAEDNAGSGVFSLKGASITSASIVRNALAFGGSDVATMRRPALRNSVCDHSVNALEGGTWGVCRLDGGATTTTTVTTTTSTTSSTLLLCETSAPVCGGRCPSTGACVAGPGGCVCTYAAPSLQDLAATTGRVAGAAVFASPLQNDPLYAATVAREYGSLGTDVELIWSNVHPARGVYDFAGVDAIVDFAQAHGMGVQGDPIVWHGYLPAYLSTLTPTELAADVEEHVRTIASRYRGRVGSWIVVNEAVADTGTALRGTIFSDTLGASYIGNAFRWAHEEDPAARLFYNDYSADGLNTKSDFIYGLVQGLLADGVPIHGVGLQMHIGGFFGAPPATIQANIQRFVDLGLAVNITELDVQTSGLGTDVPTRLAAQRTIYHDVVAACVAVAGCDTVTTWGFTDRYSWIDGAFGTGQLPLPFDADFSPKPAYFGIADALAGN